MNTLRSSSLVLGAWSLGLLSAAVGAQQADPLGDISKLTPHDVKVEQVTYRGRPAVRVVEPQVNAGGGIVVVPVELKNGVIEAQIAGAPAPGAAETSRGFVGIAFRVQADTKRYDCFYLRPTNGRADDQLRRNHSTQYISEPDFPWQRLRKETPGVYESYVDLEPGAWTRVRIVVDGTKARLHVHGAEQPTLIVNDLKQGEVSGKVALWIGQGTEAYFSNLKVTARRD
jgi:hypothetical protein